MDFQPERLKYLSTWQSFQTKDRNDALGKRDKKNNIREGKMIKTKRIFRTELFHENLKGIGIQLFRPKIQLRFVKQLIADDMKCARFTPGVARGYYNFSLSGKRKITNILSVVKSKIN